MSQLLLSSIAVALYKFYYYYFIYLFDCDVSGLSIVECLHSRNRQSCWFTETEDNVCIKIEFNFQRIGLVLHQYDRRSFALENQNSCHDVMFKRSIARGPEGQISSDGDRTEHAEIHRRYFKSRGK